MKSLKRNLFIALAAGLMIFTACGSDDGGVNPTTSGATIQFDGKTWTNPEGEDISITTLSFGGESFTTVGGNVVNGSDTLSLSMTLASREIGTYTNTNDSTAFSINLTTQEPKSYTSSIDFGSFEDLGSYSLTITSSSESAVSGEFNAVMVNPSDGTTKNASGTFTAIDFFGSFFQ